MIIKLTQLKILQTGADGGHSYVTGDIEHNGQTRKMVVFFADKADEMKLKGRTEITVDGQLIDDKNQSLNLLDSILLD